VSEDIKIQSHKGIYSVTFDNHLLDNAEKLLEAEFYFLIDAKVARLYADKLSSVLAHKNTVVIEATEANKSIDRIIPIFEHLVSNSIRRDHTLVAIGGGIIQDITCFIASTLLRGLAWRFVPTTLVAQADSCIGSKSSINLGKAKNIIGTFNPPNEVFLCTGFLDTLENKDIFSGIGEILKVHAIDSAIAFDRLAADYDNLQSDRSLLLGYIRQALLIKQRFIEVDEFDRGVRNIFNYGHSFGHAIEAATDFAIPHGIAVSMGMDMANRIAVLRGLVHAQHYLRMHPVLHKNYASFAKTPISLDDMLSALMKDKKNTSSRLVLIFPVGDNGAIQREEVAPDEIFRSQCHQFISEMSA
jgi:3-dehydroquinate synthase